jgi:RNA polymerase sigma-70 factor, ECF subfamily
MIAPSRQTFSADASTSVLWREFSAPLRQFLSTRTHTKSDADDLLQDVFVRIHKTLPTLREPAKLQGWVYRIARNAVIDHYRTRREHLPLDFELKSEDPEGRDAVDLTPALRKFIAALPTLYREPLVRHEFQGESMQDISASLGLSLTATKTRVRRARLMLRELLDRCCRFEFDHRGRVIDAIPRGSCDCDQPPSPSSADTQKAAHK